MTSVVCSPQVRKPPRRSWLLLFRRVIEKYIIHAGSRSILILPISCLKFTRVEKIEKPASRSFSRLWSFGDGQGSYLGNICWCDARNVCCQSWLSCSVADPIRGAVRYEKSSFGWKPAEKKREMFHKLGRFILVRSKESAKVVAFTSFRFEEEEEFGVVYWSVDDHPLSIVRKARQA